MQKLQKHDVGVFTTGDLPKMFEGDELAAQQREKLKRVISTDQTGRFPATSAEGHTALFVMFDFDSSYIGAEPIRGSTEGELARAWSRCCGDLKRAGFHAVLQRIDSKISKKMIAHIESNGIEIEVAAPGNHRANPAERAIQALKSHMISILY